jgi:phosphopantetheinyl transferase
MPDVISQARPHVALYDLTQATDKTLLSAWTQTLSAADAQRLKTYTSQRRRRDFIAGRFVLRSLLNHVFAERQIMVTSDQGIPKAVDNQKHEYACSISHSHHWLAVACTTGSNLGVDLEIPAAKRDIRAAARLLFSKNNLPSWLDKSDREIEQLFYAEWCAREAIIKCLGYGNVFNSATTQLSEAHGLMSYQYTNTPVPGGKANRMFLDIRWADRGLHKKNDSHNRFRDSVSPSLYIATPRERKTLVLKPLLLDSEA